METFPVIWGSTMYCLGISDTPRLASGDRELCQVVAIDKSPAPEIGLGSDVVESRDDLARLRRPGIHHGPLGEGVERTGSEGIERRIVVGHRRLQVHLTLKPFAALGIDPGGEQATQE